MITITNSLKMLIVSSAK